jgi:hypothetical protein
MVKNKYKILGFKSKSNVDINLHNTKHQEEFQSFVDITDFLG